MADAGNIEGCEFLLPLLLPLSEKKLTNKKYNKIFNIVKKDNGYLEFLRYSEKSL